MKHTAAVLFGLMISMIAGFGQTPGAGLGGIQGRVGDSTLKKYFVAATVNLLGNDSNLAKSTRTGKDGSFVLQGIAPGRYRLLISYPSYKDYAASVAIVGGMVRDLGDLPMELKQDLLAAVMVTPGKVPIHIRGDTLEYATSEIKLKLNATVEELLSRLPGLQVDADGTITYNGEKIKQLLVDGEDLFGADPSIVTRNFDASRIAKVELLDRKSDQSRFSGIDDGSRTKTLNLVLKASSKDGYFGKAEADGDLEHRYDADGLLASFRKKEQFTAIGLMANTGVTGLSGNAGGSSAAIAELSSMMDPLGASAGNGIPQFAGVALHYANAWNGADDHVFGNYQYSHLFTRPATSTYTVQTLPDTIYSQALQSRSANLQNQHWGYAVYDFEPDSLSAFSFAFDGRTMTGRNQYSDTGSSAFNSVAVNDSRRSISDGVSGEDVGGSVSWRLRSHRLAGRVFSTSAGWTSNNSETNGYVYSLNWFCQPGGTLQSMDTVDQKKNISSKDLNLNVMANFSEPLWKGAQLGLSYWLLYGNNQSVQATFNRGDGKYDDYVDSLSNDYRMRTVTQQASATLQGTNGRLTYMAAAGMQRYEEGQHDLVADTAVHYRYDDFIPRVQLSYTPDRFTHLDLGYMGLPQLPAVSQLLTTKNNANPLYVTLGNPGLRPAFMQSVNLNFIRIKALIVDVGFRLGLSSDAFSTRTATDSLGRQISQPVNVNGGKTASLNFSVNKQVSGWDVGLHSNLGYTRAVSYVNTDLNRTDSYTAGGGFNLNRYVADRYSLQFNTQFTYLDTRSSVNATAPVHYWTQSHKGSLSLLFIRGYEIRTDAVYTWQQGTPGLSGATSVLLWNAAVSRNLLAGRLVIRAQVNNLLDENAGISRTSGANVNTESSTNILGRYWMLGAVWRFRERGSGIGSDTK